MRPSLLLPPLLLLALLAGCTKEPRPVRLDFIGSGRFTSGNGRPGPGDTLSTRLYASQSDSLPLRRFRVTVDYSPTAVPLVYPATGGRPPDVTDDLTLVVLDSMLTNDRIRQLVYQTGFGTRTTAGRETWKFTVTDSKNNKAERSFALRVVRPDSAAELHQYTLRVPTAPARPARPLRALLPGLALPTSILRVVAPELARNRRLPDLVYRPGSGALEVYADPRDPARPLAQLRSTALDSTRFFALNTTAQLEAPFDAPDQALSPANSTGPLRRAQVVAFRTVEGHRGVLFVRRLPRAPRPVLELLVRVSKTPR